MLIFFIAYQIIINLLPNLTFQIMIHPFTINYKDFEKILAYKKNNIYLFRCYFFIAYDELLPPPPPLPLSWSASSLIAVAVA